MINNVLILILYTSIVLFYFSIRRFIVIFYILILLWIAEDFHYRLSSKKKKKTSIDNNKKKIRKTAKIYSLYDVYLFNPLLNLFIHHIFLSNGCFFLAAVDAAHPSTHFIWTACDSIAWQCDSINNNNNSRQTTTTKKYRNQMEFVFWIDFFFLFCVTLF